MTSSSDSGEVGSAFSTEDFRFISQFAKQNFGLNLSEAKMPLVHSRLSRRVRSLGLRDFDAYRKLLHSSDGADERSALLSALTTNVTGFFRENHHFETLRNDVIPQLVASARAGGRVRLWSAGCSTGQEPYSIAMTLLDVCPDAPALDIKILATDIDPVVVEFASKGTYSADDVAKLPKELCAKFFTATGGYKSVKEDVKSLIKFGTLNLIEKFPFSGPFDAIFCRNVAIYFDKPTQHMIWEKFSNLLTPGGYLFIGHSERVGGAAETSLRNNGITTYLKSSPEGGGAPQLASASNKDRGQK